MFNVMSIMMIEDRTHQFDDEQNEIQFSTLIGKLIEKNQENHLPPRKCAIILRANIEYLYRQNTRS